MQGERKRRMSERKLLSGEKNIIIILLSFCGFLYDGKQSYTVEMCIFFSSFAVFQLFSVIRKFPLILTSIFNSPFSCLFFTFKHQMCLCSCFMLFLPLAESYFMLMSRMDVNEIKRNHKM